MKKLTDKLASETEVSEAAARESSTAKQELSEALEEEARMKRAAEEAEARNNMLKLALKDENVQAELAEGLKQLK